MEKLFENLPFHTGLTISFVWMKIENWNNNKFSMDVDGTN